MPFSKVFDQVQRIKLGQTGYGLLMSCNGTLLASGSGDLEAARIGMQGRGFAVVADEIGKLAVKASQAAEEIGELTQGIKEQSRATKAVVTEESERILSSSQEIIGSSDIFRSITSEVCLMAASFEQVAAAVNEMNLGSRETAAASQDQAKAIEQIGHAMDTLVRTNQEMNQLIAAFNFGAHG